MCKPVNRAEKAAGGKSTAASRIKKKWLMLGPDSDKLELIQTALANAGF
jgi:hypothetical protein